MKKTLFKLLVVLSISAFVGCNGSSGENNSTQQENALVKDIEIDEFKKLVIDNPGIIVDVRTPEEVADGVIEGAMVVDITQEDFMERISKLEKGKPIYVYCKAGGRSANASEKLVGLGYQQVYNIMGGMDAWKANGYPTVN
ncbi:MAG: hydrolase [Crocinitomicaceae bacterium]|nr:hydrolase [Crocinitomicaceae bacterium]|tara:strand:+ start:1045 stop:1467 length:423 start_codon:yes stop_codon:yes gene_type:complete